MTHIIQDRHYLLDQERLRQPQPVERREENPDYRARDAFEKLMQEDPEREDAEFSSGAERKEKEELIEAKTNLQDVGELKAKEDGQQVEPSSMLHMRSRNNLEKESQTLQMRQSLANSQPVTIGKSEGEAPMVSAHMKAAFIQKIEQIASQIYLSAGEMGDKGKLTIHIKDSILPKTQLTIEKLTTGDFKVQFTTSSFESSNLLQMHQSSLAQQLNGMGQQKFEISAILRAEEERSANSDGQNEGHSRGEYIADEENEEA